MKQFCAAMLLLCMGSVALASGKISLQNNFYNEGETYRPMVGLAIYHKMWDDQIAVNSWTGYGVQPLVADDVNWISTKNQLDIMALPKLTVSPGFQYSFVAPWDDQQLMMYLKVDYQLW